MASSMESMFDLDLKALLATYGGGHGTWSDTMLAFTILGSGWSALLLGPLVYWRRTRRFAQALVIAIIIQGIAIWSVKHVVGRTRPWIALGYPPPFGAPHDGSFPSGHASGSFCVAAFLVVALPAAWPAVSGAPWRARLVAAGSVVIAVFVCLSRVYLGCHWPTDVMGGALMGSCVGATAGGLYLSERASGAKR
jgi:membrane-associated phospholipid phosphatase